MDNAFGDIDELLNRNRTQLEQDFGLCSDLLLDIDASNFAGGLGGIFTNAIKYNGQSNNLLYGNTQMSPFTVKQLCELMLTPGKTGYENLIHINEVNSDEMFSIPLT